MHVPKSRPCLLLLVVFTATLFTSLSQRRFL